MPKISALPAGASVTGDDLLVFVNDPFGVPVVEIQPTIDADGSVVVSAAESTNAIDTLCVPPDQLIVFC